MIGRGRDACRRQRQKIVVKKRPSLLAAWGHTDLVIALILTEIVIAAANIHALRQRFRQQLFATQSASVGNLLAVTGLIYRAGSGSYHRHAAEGSGRGKKGQLLNA